MWKYLSDCFMRYHPDKCWTLCLNLNSWPIMLVKALLSSTKAAMALPSSMSARTPRTLSRFCASAIYQVDFLSTLTDLYLLSKVNFTIWVPTSQDLDGTSFMGSRLRIEHSRDSRDARDRGRYSPPRGRYGWVQKNSINIKSLLWSLLSLIATQM